MTYLINSDGFIINHGIIIYSKITYSSPPLITNAGIKTMLINNNEGPNHGNKGPSKSLL